MTRAALVYNSAFCPWHWRRRLLVELVNRDMSVSVLCPDGPDARLLHDIGVQHVPLAMGRFTTPWRDARLLGQLHGWFRTHRPDLVHTETLKPNVIGAIAAHHAGVPRIVGHVNGLGSLCVEGGGTRRRCLRHAVTGGYGPFSGNSFSTPLAAGAASLLLAYKPDLYNDDIHELLRISARDEGDPGYDPVYGAGILDINAAIGLLIGGYWKFHHVNAIGGSSVGNTDYQSQTFYDVSGLTDGNYYVKRYDVRKSVTFPTTFAEPPHVWGRGVATRGFSSANPNWGVGWCKPLNVTSYGCTMQTFVYDVYRFHMGNLQRVGWYPTSPSGAVFAYTVLGHTATVGVGDEQALSADVPHWVHVPNPWTGAGVLRFMVPSTSRA